MRPRVLGIVNLTRDSFSDGGRFLAPDAALAHARRLAADGADIVDLGAESSHPDAADVADEEQIARLAPVVRALRAEGVAVSIDAHRPAVIAAMLALGVEWINDVSALRDERARVLLREASARIIVMHSVSADARAERVAVPAGEMVERSLAFFRGRVAELAAAGIARERLVLDPGMGLFLGSDARASVVVLRSLRRLRGELGLPLCICTSRKSFVGVLAAADGAPRPPAERGAATLASELYAARQGVEYIRTHDVRSLREGLRVQAELENSE